MPFSLSAPRANSMAPPPRIVSFFSDASHQSRATRAEPGDPSPDMRRPANSSTSRKQAPRGFSGDGCLTLPHHPSQRQEGCRVPACRRRACLPYEGNLACAPSFDFASASVAAGFSRAPLTLWNSHSCLFSLLLTPKIAPQRDAHPPPLPYKITFPSATTATYLPS
jgi:hypothetical protein